MKTVLVTGGASGLGKGVAMHYLKEGDRVIAVGSSASNGNTFYNEARQIGVEERALFINADLSLVKEARRVTDEIKNRFDTLDAIVFCATKHSLAYTQTADGFELTFALDYLSRFILSYGLKEMLEKSDNPIVINVCGTGMKGDVNWSDLQHKNGFDAQKVMMHGSRLNDLLGAGFVHNDSVGEIKYVLYNPWAVQTPGMMAMYSGPLMKLLYKMIGKPIDKAIRPISELLDSPPTQALSAYREHKKLDTTLPMYNQENAKKLYNMTVKMLDGSVKITV